MTDQEALDLLFPGNKDFVQKIRNEREADMNQEITKKLSATGSEAFLPYAEKAQAFRENKSIEQIQVMKSASSQSAQEEEKKESLSQTVSVEQMTT